MITAYKDLTGMMFGRLIVIEHVGTRNGHSLWKCKCDCGNVVEVVSGSLVSGNTQSCGCFRSQFAREKFTTHGMHGIKIYNVWRGMKSRCMNINTNYYSDYGGRGISVCEEWLEFINFYNWAMNSGYNGILTLDRVDNDGNYEPDNCRWSTMKEQANNTRTNVWYEYRGESKTLSQWSDICGIAQKRLRDRIGLGWTIERALFTPVRIQKKYEKRR